MFSILPEAPFDPILGTAKLIAADTSPNKINLGIGVYKNAAGQAPVLDTVKRAEQFLLENQKTKTYLSSSGNDGFRAGIENLLLGDNADLHQRARTAQTPGGTGALRLAADFIRYSGTAPRIFLPRPTWANHEPVFKSAGLEIVYYPYYDIASGELLFDEMQNALRGLKTDDILLLHGCCHNPTGADLDPSQWEVVAEILGQTGAIPLIDIAYLGFAKGITEDAYGVKLLAAQLPEVLIAASCSKNFSLYRERVGALTLLCANDAQADKAFGHLMAVARTNWSMPPDHGAATVAHILTNEKLNHQWQDELNSMRSRITQMRHQLARCFHQLGLERYNYIAKQHGMFAMLNLSKETVDRLRIEHHLFVAGMGRINVAGLTEANIQQVAESIAAVQ